MPHAFPRILTFGLACCAFAPAATPLVPNLHLGVAWGQGDFKNEIGSKHGLDVGLSLTAPLTTTLSIRPILAFQTFPTMNDQYVYKSSRYSDRGEENTRWNAWSIGADCVFRPQGPEGGIYFLAGAHMKAWGLHGFGTYSTSDRLNATRVYTVDDRRTKNIPGFALGLGYTFVRHVSFESRAVFTSYEGLSYNTLEASLVLSF
jgi:hypothetical protein